MPKFTETEEVKIERLIKKGTLSLIDNDRPYNEAEEEAEKKAVKFPLAQYPRIQPIPGTLGFLLRNIKGGNASVIQFIKEASGTNQSRFIGDFITLWNAMDEASQKRVDIFDILCEKWNVKKKKFWGIIQEGMFDHNDMLSQIALSGQKAEFVELLIRMSRQPKNHKDRELLAHALGMKKDSPFLQVNDNSTHTQTNVKIDQINNLPAFARSMRKLEEPVRNLEKVSENRVKELPEGTENYIDAEWSDVRKGMEDFTLIERRAETSAKEERL